MTIGPSNSTPQSNKNTDSNKHLYTNAHSSTIHEGKEWHSPSVGICRMGHTALPPWNGLGQRGDRTDWGTAPAPMRTNLSNGAPGRRARHKRSRYNVLWLHSHETPRPGRARDRKLPVDASSRGRERGDGRTLNAQEFPFEEMKMFGTRWRWRSCNLVNV